MLEAVRAHWNVILSWPCITQGKSFGLSHSDDVTLENVINGTSLLHANPAQSARGPHFTTKGMKHLNALSLPANTPVSSAPEKAAKVTWQYCPCLLQGSPLPPSEVSGRD